MAMREKFTKPGSSIYYYLVEWDSTGSAKLSWEDFRGKVLGATDPSTAEAGSLRKEIFANWKTLGLKSEPNVGDKGVHASASPFEGLAEKMNWLQIEPSDDAFGKVLLETVSPEMLKDFTVDPQVLLPGGDGKKGSLFDQLEDMDFADAVAKVKEIAAAQ